MSTNSKVKVLPSKEKLADIEKKIQTGSVPAPAPVPVTGQPVSDPTKPIDPSKEPPKNLSSAQPQSKSSTGPVTGAGTRTGCRKSLVWKNIITILTILAIGIAILAVFLIRTELDLDRDFWTNRRTSYLAFVGELFLNLLHCMVIPLITSTMIATIGSMDMKVGKFIPARGFALFTLTTLLSILIGLLFAKIIRPGSFNVEFREVCEEPQSVARSLWGGQGQGQGQSRIKSEGPRLELSEDAVMNPSDYGLQGVRMPHLDTRYLSLYRDPDVVSRMVEAEPYHHYQYQYQYQQVPDDGFRPRFRPSSSANKTVRSAIGGMDFDQLAASIKRAIESQSKPKNIFDEANYHGRHKKQKFVNYAPRRHHYPPKPLYMADSKDMSELSGAARVKQFGETNRSNKYRAGNIKPRAWMPCIPYEAYYKCQLEEDTLTNLIRSFFPINIAEATLRKTNQVVPDFHKYNDLGVTLYIDCDDFNLYHRPYEEIQDYGLKSISRPGTNVLGLVVFSIALGIAALHIGDVGLPFLHFFISFSKITQKWTNWVIFYSPLGVCSLIMANLIRLHTNRVGAEVTSLVAYLATVLASLLIQSLIVLPLIYLAFARKSPIRLYRDCASAIFTAFKTGSSDESIPSSIKCLQENVKVNPTIAGFLIPSGSEINFNGHGMYHIITVLYIAEKHGMRLSYGDYVALFCVVCVATVATVGIPSGSLFALIFVVNSMGLESSDIAYVLVVEWLLDRCCTVTNVLSDLVVSATVHHCSTSKLEELNKYAEEMAAAEKRAEEELTIASKEALSSVQSLTEISAQGLEVQQSNTTDTSVRSERSVKHIP